MGVVLRLKTFVVLLLLSGSALAAVTVKKGDTLFRISQRSGVSVERLRALNGLSGNLIRPGQVLKTGGPLPKFPGQPLSQAPIKAPAKPAPTKGPSRYTVRPGDSLSKIAQRSGSSVAALQRANRLSGSLIRVGQVLSVPPPGSSGQLVARVPSLPPGTEARIIYTYTNVGLHDTFLTLSRTAQKNAHLSPAQFMKLNQLGAAWVYPGMKVLLPVRVPVPIPPTPRHPPATLSAMTVLNVPVRVVRVDLRHRGVLVSAVLPSRGLGSSARVSTLARLSGAVAVINGSYFHPRSFIPAGDLVVRGQRLAWGRIPAALSITPDNRAHIGSSAGSTWAGMETVIASGPQLVRGGAVQVHYSPVFQDPALFGRAARSAIGLSSNRDLILVSTHARLTITEMGKIMAQLGARDALLLDGGSSAGLTWNNTPILESLRSVAYGIGVFLDYQGRRYSRT